LDEALELINRAIDLAGPSATLLDTRACVYQALGRTDDALADLSAAIARQPSAVWYFHAAIARRAAGDKSATREALAQAESLGLAASQLHPLEQSLLAQLRDSEK
jgi:tetratricopeptide (TPR) repeat protein